MVRPDPGPSSVSRTDPREPVTTAAELMTLDHGEIAEGYSDGYGGDAEPGGNRAKAYWHGWRNGNNDRHHRSDAAQIALIRDLRANGLLKVKTGNSGTNKKALRQAVRG